MRPQPARSLAKPARHRVRRAWWLGARFVTPRGRRLTSAVMAVGLVAGGAAAVTGALPRLGAAPAHADEITASQNNLRTGWDSHEPGLAPATVSGPTFGQLFDTSLNGQIYAQPVVAGHVLIVATETNHVYGLNAATGAVEWSRYLGPAESATTLNCSDLAPSVGVTSTPVYDSRTGTVYLVAVVEDTPPPAPPHVYAYALSAQTGAVSTGWPVPIHGSPVNAAICTSATGDSTFSVGQQAREVAPLRPGPDTVTVAVTQSSGTSILTVWLDGAQVLQHAVPTLTATALLAFTGATTLRTDVHLVRDAALLAAS